MLRIWHATRRARPVWLVVAALCVAGTSACMTVKRPTTPERRGPDDAYLAAQIARARALALGYDPQWLKLLHYRAGMFGGAFLGHGYESEADGPDFFLSPEGKHDPQAELDATLRALFRPLDAEGAQGEPRAGGSEERGADAHALCRFPARFLYLNRRLGLELGRLPVQSCPKLEQFLSDLSAQSVTLVFSSYFLNNPASAFGHTFLRLNKRAAFATSERRELLDYGIDFSANVDTGNAIVYAFKGLSGMFPGTFKRIPFFYKVREYNDYESRDLWEYELEIPPEQLTLLTAHLWELGHTWFAYYYMSENCSYHILAALEVARPDLDLVGSLSSPIIPSDTVKALHANPGLVRKVSYRPSLRRQLAARVDGLDGEQRDAVESLASEPDAPLPADWSSARKIAVFDAAADLVDLLYAKEIATEPKSDGARRKQRILERRAAILVPSAPLSLRTPWHEAPEQGHGSRRVGLGGATSSGALGVSLDFRLALHDLADPADGYLGTAAIEFGHGRLQLWSGRLELDDASLFRVTSLTPQSRFDHSLSWELDVGGTTVVDRACDHCLGGHISGGTGAAFELFDPALLLYVLAYGQLMYAHGLSGIEESHVRVGIGPSGGLRLRLHPDLIALVSGRIFWLPGQEPQRTYRVDATLRWQFVDDFALGLEGRRTPGTYEAQALSFVYF